MKEQKGIIFAADIEEKQSLLNIIQKISPYIKAIKLGNVALYKNGWSMIKEIKEFTDRPIIVDLKLMDIPEIAQRLTISAINAGADGMMVCGITGEETICDCLSIIKHVDKMLFIFTQFTHDTGLISDEMANEYIDLAIKLTCDGIQVPGTRLERITEAREKVGNRLMVISCGIGAQGPQYGSAIQAGADYEIIGRQIYNSKKPEDEACKARDQILGIMKAQSFKLGEN
ncbi:MAG TPA: orotidine-5'-phosphate decarboxylase [Candidatus Brocadiaceae bacterium]